MTVQLTCGVSFVLIAALTARAESPAPAWMEISTKVLEQLEGQRAKIAWPGRTAGVAVDPSTGDVFMIVPGQGIWKSADLGRTFARADRDAIGGRCETSYSLQFDPAGKRLACFMLDGRCGLTVDGGKTWRPFTGLGRNWDYAAVDWSSREVKHIFGARHETGGEVFLSHDTGKTWTKLFENPEFEKSGGLGIFDGQTLVYTMKGKGIQRSTDAGKTWTRISDAEPWGRVVTVRKGVGYWLSREGVLVSRDRGATWSLLRWTLKASIGPYFDPEDDARWAVAGVQGIHESTDGGKTWTHVAPLPKTFDLPKAGWFSNVAWDPRRGVYYASRMGRGTFRLETGRSRPARDASATKR